MPIASKVEAGAALSPRLIKYFLAVLAVLALLNGLGAYWTYERWIAANEQRQRGQAAQVVADREAAAVGQRLRQFEQQLASTAQQEAVAKALADSNRGALAAVTQDLEQQLPAGSRVRLLGDEGPLAQADRNSIRFAEMDMINRAERGQRVLPEATAGEDGEWRLSLVQAVPAADADSNARAQGVLLASVPTSALLPESDPDGRIELLQRFPDTQAQVLQVKGSAAGEQSWQASVPSSYLLLRYHPSPDFLSAIEVSSTGFIIAVVLVALASIALAYVLALALMRLKVSGKNAAVEAPAEESLLDLQVSQEDTELLGLKSILDQRERTSRQAVAEDPLDIRDAAADTRIAAEIFRSYDIRGLANTQLSPEAVLLIGRAIGSAALAAGENCLVVARDGRIHSPEISEQLVDGILATGCDVVNIGMVPSPLMYFACHELGRSRSGVMVTASHNPPEYNGFKIVIAGNTLKDEEIQALRSRILQQDFASGSGKEDFRDFSQQYIDRIFSDVALAGELTVVIDAGNGVTGALAPRLFEELGCQVTPLFCEIDGNFPNHAPDPSIADNLQALVAKVREVGADLGVAFDGDGDRVAVVTGSGQLVAADQLLMLLAKDVVARNPGADVVFDVKCSRELNKVISAYGGRPIMWKAGHSHMKAKMKESGALLGGELSGHIFIKERWYGFDDGLYAAARLMEIMSLREQDLDSILENFPRLPSTPELKVSVDESRKFSLVEELIAKGNFGAGRLTTIDGLRVDFPDSWGLVRPSNTSAALTLRFEAESEAALQQVIELFKTELRKVDPELPLDF